MGEMEWRFNLFGIRIGWYKHFSAVCYDRRNRLLKIGKLELWFYGLN